MCRWSEWIAANAHFKWVRRFRYYAVFNGSFAASNQVAAMSQMGRVRLLTMGRFSATDPQGLLCGGEL
ncbi:MAG: hypothetical protein MUF16_23665, partial [Burkholderiaceae bacterium]|nr:hypothetical protein [Burkholderiaceae bacterium]